MKSPSARTGRDVLTIFAAVLLGFALAETVLLILRVPSLLQPSHWSGLLSLLVSIVILYTAIALYFLGFWLMLWIVSRVLRLRFSAAALATITVFLAPLFLVLQEKLQTRMLGTFISLGSPYFYVPTLIMLAGTVVALVAVRFALLRHDGLLGPMRKAFRWPGLIATSALAFLLLTFINQPKINTLGVFSEDEQRAATKQVPPEQPAAASPGSPNFIVLKIEAFRSDHFTPENAPFLWSLARKHVELSRYHVVAPATRPSVTSFFTSLYPVQHGCYNLALTPDENGGGPQTTTKVAATIVSLPKLLQDHGYRTLQVTSNTLATDPAFGFEDVFIRFDAAEPYSFAVPALDALIGFRFLKRNLMKWRIFKILVFSPEHSTAYFDSRRVNRTVKRELAQRDERPFYLYVHYMEPHAPYYHHPYRPLQINLYTTALLDDMVEAYASEIRAVDREIADLFGFLDEAGLLSDSYVLITADHGEEFYDHRNWGHGKSLYPEVLGVPAILVTPGESPPLLLDDVLESIDVAPTFAQLAGLEQPEFWEGRSFASRLTGAVGAPDSALQADGEIASTVAFSQFDTGRSFLAGVVSQDCQLIFQGRDQKRRVMLFDLAEDPNARHDLYGQEDEREADLVGMLEDNLMRLEATAEYFRGEEQEIDPKHLEQLKALGYVD